MATRTRLHTLFVDLPLDEHAAAIERLVEDGADPNSADEAGWTPLHFACQEWSISGARRLIAFGAKVDAADDHGNTPLWRAVFASRGRGDLIGVLLAAGANPDAPNEAGITPRQLSERIGNYDVRSFFDKQPD